MNKNTLLKLQLFLSIGFAALLIIVSTVFFYRQLSNFLNRNDKILSELNDQIANATEIETELLQIIQAKAYYSLQEDQSYKEQQQTASVNVEQLLDSIQLFLGSIQNKNLEQKLDKVDFLVANTINFEKFKLDINHKSKEDIIIDIIAEQKNIKTTITTFTNELRFHRNELLQENNKEIAYEKNLNLIIIAIALSVIFFVFYKIYQALQYIRNSSHKLKRLNADYEEATVKIENTNWALQSNSLLVEKLSGIDDDNKISKIVSDQFNKLLPVLASNIYVRRTNSPYFHLKNSTGVNKENEIKIFTEGEGFLGKTVQDKKNISLPITNYPSLKSNTSIITDIPSTVYLFPLIHEDSCVGLIELALKYDESLMERYEIFLQRASANIATNIKFGQSHLVVEQLLLETQHQTEELEAQQEELRITNEELIHKTHLLESSEEELRVQQEELTQTNIELNHKAQELEQKNKELNNAQGIVEQKINEIEQASKYKSEFMANMSHELRTPLNSILILAKLLNDNKSQNLTSDQVKYAHVIHSAGTDLLALINELLDLAKIESGKIDLNADNIYINDFVQIIEELFKELAKDKEIDFSINIDSSTPEKINSDEGRLQQVIKNFLSNAFKFTNKNGKVSLDIYEKNSNIYFQVKDSGKGISKEKQDLIFEAFRQEDGSTSRKYGGTGLGLSISKEIASLLNGRIQVESELDKGSIFTLIIPITIEGFSNEKAVSKQTSAPMEIPEVKNQNPIEKEVNIPSLEREREILIIEDDVNFADILKGFAENYGFKTLLAHDGAKGIKLAQKHLPDAIILDVMLPISDGWEVLNELKIRESTKHIPIHMMSAANFNKKDFLEKGAIGFMQKPVTEDAIRITFENISLNLSTSVKKVLLIEDQELQSDFIKNTFSEQKVNVIQAFSMEAGLTKIKEETSIDCIILDLHLPDGDGIEFIEKIKEDPLSNNIPIIINTAAELTKEQHNKILSYAKATVLKTEKSNERLIDEVNLFLNKINDSSYQPIRNPEKMRLLTNENILDGRTVLIADDDMRNVFALSTSLQAYGMNIEIANNGVEAVKVIEERGETIDIVLMDIMMPEMDGHEAIERIRSNFKYKNLPILAVTAKAMKGDKEKSIQIGANDYVSKPIDINKLTSLIHIWLS